jgi:nucleoside-diphosphate-sugar epimerase
MLNDPLAPKQLTALVTGSTGFTGRHLVRKLQAIGWHVHTLERQSRSEHGKTSNVLSGSTNEKTVHFYGGTIDDVISAVSGSAPDVVFHLASMVLTTHTPAQIAPLIEANVLLGTQLLEAITSKGIGSFVNAGTYWQYYQGANYLPVNLYAATKQAFEDIIVYYTSAKRLRALTLNLFDSYGPDDHRKKLLPLLLACHRKGERLKMSGGMQPLDLVHVDDVCDAFVHAYDLLQQADRSGYQSYAVSGNERRSLRELVATVEGVVGKDLNIEFGALPYREREVMHLWEGTQLPGWAPKIRLKDGLKAIFERQPRKNS